jgi:DNA invertase Pin-like site-specific DNA recombinase
MGCRLIAYLRVSTEKQGVSGLGLEAQDAAIQAHIRAAGGMLIASYTEIETGKRDDLDNRPELLRAIAHARRSRATLVFAKMDRLARSVYVLATLHRGGVDFVACDNPNANRLTVQILMAVAENEARMISERTRAALAAYKARGGLLGASRPECRNLTDEARRRGCEAAAKARRDEADAAYADLIPMMRQWRIEGLSQAKIAARLDELGHTTRRGSRWNQGQVSRVLSRAK